MRLPGPRRGGPRLCRLAALLAGAACLPLQAVGQSDEDLAPRARLTIGQQIAIDDGDLIGITPIDLSVQTGTRAQNFDLSVSAPLNLGDPEDDSFVALGDTAARLTYRRFSRNASFETALSYVETDLDREIFFDQVEDTLVTLDQGRRADSNVRVGYAFGSQSRLGAELGLSYGRRDYIDTVDPDLADSETVQGEARLFLEPTPMIRARILASGLRTDSDPGGTDTRSVRVGAGAAFQIDKITSLDAELARSQIRRSDQADDTRENSEGLSLRLGGTRSRPDGDYTLSYSSDPGTDGRRDQILVGRSLERPTYELSLAAGLSRLEGNDPDTIFRIGYAREVDQLSQVQLSLQRRAVTDIDGDEAVNTDVTASYDRQISELSSVGVSLFYRESQVLSGDSEDAQRVALDIRYSRAIINDFSLVAGYNISRGTEADSSDDDDSERIYLGLNRSFDWRF